ncbi:MAG: porin, partial [Betaproteobacteria bacterium AqS2]|nr:porin [Betaproteobacteria bacterium AqS2]
MKRTSILAAAVAAVLAAPAGAAIDGDGMAYVSASEGLSGAVVVNLFEDSDEDDVDGTTKLKEIVLSYGGSADLGGGLQSTYGFTLKTETDKNGDEAPIWVDGYHVGLEAPFGTLWAGHVAGVTDANVPGGSLDSVAGSSDVGLTGNNAGQLRYESPRINGLKLGLSGVVNGRSGDDGGPEGSLDQLNLMAHYELPVGLTLAAGYESKDRKPEGSGLAAVSDKASGFRFGAEYAQDNWKVAYNYRKYNEHEGFAYDKEFHVAPSSGNTPIPVTRTNSATEYQGHRMAAQFVVDRITLSANYSTETVSTDVAGAAKAKIDLDRTTLGVDAKYALGSKSW